MLLPRMHSSSMLDTWIFFTSKEAPSNTETGGTTLKNDVQ